jgi:lipid A ethanolaminephosphotransferase
MMNWRGWSELHVRPEIAVLYAAGYFLVAPNLAFWRHLHAAVAPSGVYEWMFLAAVAVEGFCLLNLLFGLFAAPYVLKPALTAFLLITAGVAYFVDEYGTVVDMHMIRNVFETNREEAADLVTPKLVIYLIALGFLPAGLLWWSKIRYRPFWSDVRFKASAALAFLSLMLATALPFTQDITSVFREHRVLLHVFSPLNYLVALNSYLRKRTTVTAIAPFGEDARKDVSWDVRQHNTLTVIVVGETARAQNFSLNGYGRPTNPLLGSLSDLVSFSRAYSCGTDTAQSVSCMFSGLGRSRYNYEQAMGKEGLLDILQRAGFSVLWRENQSGCKGACRGVPTEFVTTMSYRKFYELGNSLDENLLTNLQERIDMLPGDAVIVLHMMGSHGPAYYQRYPAEFERFRPACQESQFSRCRLEEIVNSYDNTIVYTDHILSRLIELLRANDANGRATAMIYVSDHGESLGENNLYLHGLPYAIAPDVQKRIPMLLWLSPKFRVDFLVDVTCLQQRRDERVSHDNLFHSVLGLLGVQTRVYDRRLDLFAPCRGSSPMRSTLIDW